MLFHRSKARFRFMKAGARVGKSMAAGWEWAWEVIAPLREGQVNQNRKIWFVAPRYSLASKEFEWFLEAIREFEKLLLCVVKSVHNHPETGLMDARIEVEDTAPDGEPVLLEHVVHCYSEKDVIQLLGDEIDGVNLCEGALLRLSTWDSKLQARLMKRRGKVVIPTTPCGQTWIFERFWRPFWGNLEEEPGRPDPYHSPDEYVRWSNKRMARGIPDRGEYWAAGFTQYDVPEYLPRDEVERFKATSEELAFREQGLGEAVSYSGMVYSEFRRTKHVIRPLPAPLPASWRRLVGLDHGAGERHASVVLIGAISPEGVIYFYSCHYCVGGLIECHCEWAARQLAPWRMNPEMVICAGDKSAPLQEYAKCGLPVIPAPSSFKDQKKAGINRVNSLLKIGRIYFYDLPEMAKGLWEMEHFKWLGVDDAQKPVKLDVQKIADHWPDALRYACDVAWPIVPHERATSPHLKLTDLNPYQEFAKEVSADLDRLMNMQETVDREDMDFSWISRELDEEMS